MYIYIYIYIYIYMCVCVCAGLQVCWPYTSGDLGLVIKRGTFRKTCKFNENYKKVDSGKSEYAV